MIADLRARARALIFRRRWQRELDEELHFHLEQDVAARIAAGAEPAAARREALAAFGGIERWREATLDASGVRPLHDLAADLRFTLRGLGRNPAFALTAVLVLALAIGAATAVFSVVHTVLLSDLPYPHADRLVQVYQQNSPTNQWTLSVVDIQAIAEQQRSFEAFGAVRPGVAGLAGGGEPEQVPVAWVTAGFLSALGTTPATGRLIEPGDERPDAPPVVVVTARLAADRLGGLRSAVGRALLLDGVSHTVVGVLPPGLDELAGIRAAAWPVLRTATPARRGPFGLRGVGRLRPQLTLAAAGRDLAGISRRIYPLWRAGFRDSLARLTPYPLRESIVGSATQQLRLFAGAVLLVLLGALANVATLLLVRASARGHELAVRATLGASRLRVARLVLTEGLVLTALGTLAGIGLAALALRLVGLIAPDLPRAHEIVLDARSVAVAVALGAASGLLVSLSPVMAVLGGRLVALRPEGRRSGGTRWTGLVRGVLVAAEVALAIPLLLAAALLANSLLRLQRVDPGYDAGSSLTVWLAPPPARYPDTTAVRTFWRRAVAVAVETPGVVAAGLATSAPPDNQGEVNNFNLTAHPVPEGGAEPTSPWSAVSPGFFPALGIPLHEGRLFTDADSAGAPPVAVVSRSWAARYFPGESVIGQQMVEGGCYECPRTTIVGMVGDVKYQGLGRDGEGVYTPLMQSESRRAALFVRTSAAPAGFTGPVLRHLRALDPDLPLSARLMKDELRRALADPTRWTAVLSAFGAAALALSSLGIFGLVSYLVRRQRREIGVRLALGAEPRAILRMVLARGMRYVLAGTVVGLVLTAVSGRWLGSLLFEVGPNDPLTIGGVTATLLLAALAACLVPGLQAGRIRPVEAMAEE
ncbi:MAG TPA: ADOP family duplicated permease [Gemmatimonadales bacterium]|nr:ADOP family duplicated permease [Gemmatimonadales bacterium]